ncbi:MAG TPA: hypothetical protein VEC16_01950 [Alphaproteobacteria bacterium]|nr:hypothetical protein [Alphaproteobacteria bacterium]
MARTSKRSGQGRSSNSRGSSSRSGSRGDSGMMDTAAAVSKETYDRLKSNASKIKSNVNSNVSRLKSDLQSNAKTTRKDIDNYIKSNPEKSVMIAAGVGAVFGAMLAAAMNNRKKP